MSEESRCHRSRGGHLPLAATLFHAGESVPPGIYQEVESQRLVHLEATDVLPPSFDGRVASYTRVETEGVCKNCGRCKRSAS